MISQRFMHRQEIVAFLSSLQFAWLIGIPKRGSGFGQDNGFLLKGKVK
jgi:hypothetical protein